jgi:hypothetical protein
MAFLNLVEQHECHEMGWLAFQAGSARPRITGSSEAWHIGLFQAIGLFNNILKQYTNAAQFRIHLAFMIIHPL